VAAACELRTARAWSAPPWRASLRRWTCGQRLLLLQDQRRHHRRRPAAHVDQLEAAFATLEREHRNPKGSAEGARRRRGQARRIDRPVRLPLRELCAPSWSSGSMFGAACCLLLQGRLGCFAAWDEATRTTWRWSLLWPIGRRGSHQRVGATGAHGPPSRTIENWTDALTT
jgi:hypothetical protein